MAKIYTKKALEKAHHLSIGRILYYLYWTQHKNWKEVALELDVPQKTVEKWAEESGIESRSYAHQMMLPTKTVAEIEKEYGKPLNEVLFYLMLKAAVRAPAVKPKEIKALPSLKEPPKKQPKQKKEKKQIVVKHKRGYGHYTTEEIETLKRMRLGGFSDKEIDSELGRPRGSAFAKANKLGLSRAHIRETSIPKKDAAPTKGIVKCHNCLEEIKLTKEGLGKKYSGATRVGEWLFWHLPGQCTGDPDAHANLLHEDKPYLDTPGRFWITKGGKD